MGRILVHARAVVVNIRRRRRRQFPLTGDFFAGQPVRIQTFRLGDGASGGASGDRECLFDMAKLVVDRRAEVKQDGERTPVVVGRNQEVGGQDLTVRVGACRTRYGNCQQQTCEAAGAIFGNRAVCQAKQWSDAHPGRQPLRKESEPHRQRPEKSDG